MLITIRAIVDSILTVDLISLLYFKYALTMDLISLLQQLALSSLSIDNILSIDCLSKYCNNIFNILREPYAKVGGISLHGPRAAFQRPSPTALKFGPWE